MLKEILSLKGAIKDLPDIEDIPMPENIEEKRNLEYDGQDGFKLHADIFKPKEEDHKTPVAIVVHGGGFAAGNQTMELPFSRVLSSRGFLVYAIDYRIVDRCTVFEPIKDVIAGFNYVLNTLDEYNGDWDNIYVISESAGAYVSIYAQAFSKNRLFMKWFNYQTSDISIKGNVFVSGMFYANRYDLIGFTYKNSLFGNLRKDKELMRLMNPECKEVLSILSPSVFVSSNYDFIENYTLDYQKAFDAYNKDNLLIIMNGDKTLCHAFATLSPYLKESTIVMDRFIAYFEN